MGNKTNWKHTRSRATQSFLCRRSNAKKKYHRLETTCKVHQYYSHIQRRIPCVNWIDISMARAYVPKGTRNGTDACGPFHSPLGDCIRCGSLGTVCMPTPWAMQTCALRPELLTDSYTGLTQNRLWMEGHACKEDEMHIWLSKEAVNPQRRRRKRQCSGGKY